MPRILFFDTNETIIEELKKKFSQKEEFYINYEIGNIENICQSRHIDAIVSPANSFGYMDGGIDAIYMRMFENIENIVMDFVKNNGVPNSVGEKYMPIGSAFFVPLKCSNKQKIPLLISAPTMYLPQPIVGTYNVYYAFLAILQLTKTWDNNNIIAIPGLGTGIGDIDPIEHANQIYNAYHDFNNGTFKYDDDIKISEDYNYYILNKGACLQRDIECDEDDEDYNINENIEDISF